MPKYLDSKTVLIYCPHPVLHEDVGINFLQFLIKQKIRIFFNQQSLPFFSLMNPWIRICIRNWIRIWIRIEIMWIHTTHWGFEKYLLVEVVPHFFAGKSFWPLLYNVAHLWYRSLPYHAGASAALHTLPVVSLISYRYHRLTCNSSSDESIGHCMCFYIWHGYFFWQLMGQIH
jgi:hypothetical protein